MVLSSSPAAKRSFSALFVRLYRTQSTSTLVLNSRVDSICNPDAEETWRKNPVIHSHTHTHTHTYAHIYTHTHTYTQIHTHTHTYTYTLTHTHTHTFTYTHFKYGIRQSALPRSRRTSQTGRHNRPSSLARQVGLP